MMMSSIDVTLLPDTEWYLAIGSMINPISLQLRELAPIRSYPAKVPNWKIIFKGAGGMASLEQAEGAHMHGVLHLMTTEHMKVLDSIEASYNRVPVECHLYDGETKVTGTAYVMDDNKIDKSKPDAPPGERYLDIITRGCEHFGVDAEYTQWLRQHPCTPRKQPHEYRCLPMPLECPMMKLEEIAHLNGQDDRDLCLSINGKIAKYIGDRNSPMFKNFVKNWGGQDITHRTARMLYEPRYKPAFTREDMSPEHCCFAEELFCGWGGPTNWQVIGRLPPRAIDVNTPPGHVWYLAIGSMINPVSLALRDLRPVRSYAARVPNWRLLFKGSGGMATLDRAEGEVMHGVVHLMTDADMKALDTIEFGYNRVPVQCFLDDESQSQVQASGYVMDLSKVDASAAQKPDGLPSERYLDIIVRGCRHFGVDPSWIQWLQSLPCTPRKQPHEFAKFPVPEECPVMTAEDIATCDGADGRDLCCILNKKVLKFVGDPHSPMFDNMRKNFAAQDVTFRVVKLVYEPRYKPAFKLEDMSEEHCCFAEDMMAGFSLPNWRVIGVVQQRDPNLPASSSEPIASASQSASSASPAAASAASTSSTSCDDSKQSSSKM